MSFIRKLSVAQTVYSGAPYIAYTDIVSGPDTGGEGGNGIPLTIFGTNFGSDISAITVTVNGTAVAQKYYLGSSRASDSLRTIQAIGVQIASGTTTGAIKITVGGVDSNTDHTFTVQTGTLVFISTTGSDGNPGTFASPKAITTLADWSPSAGTHAILRGGDYTTGLGSNGILVHNVSGTSSASISVIGYPGENARIVSSATHATGMALRIYHNSATPAYIAVANLIGDVSGGPGNSVFGLSDQMGADHIRCVNCEASGMFENSGGSAAITGSFTNTVILGNYVHDNDGNKLYHSIYCDSRIWDGTWGTDGSTAIASTDIEIAYNKIKTQKGGRGVQIFGGTNHTGATIKNVNIHHNWIEATRLDGIVLSHQTSSGCKVWCNVVTGCGDSALEHGAPVTDTGTGGNALRFTDSGGAEGNTLEVEVFNNTFVLNNIDTTAAEFSFELYTSLVMRNNGIYTTRTYTTGADTTTRTSSNNGWNGNGVAPGFDTDPQTDAPNFVSLADLNFDLAADSAWIGTGHSLSGASFTVDRDFLLRPMNSTKDIGAFASQV